MGDNFNQFFRFQDSIVSPIMFGLVLATLRAPTALIIDRSSSVISVHRRLPSK